jgi:hypothetical protein
VGEFTADPELFLTPKFCEPFTKATIRYVDRPDATGAEVAGRGLVGFGRNS